MSWVTCQLAASGVERAVNTDLVLWADDKRATTVLTMVGGQQFSILGGLQEWLNEVELAAKP
jgi:hypothetical protein